MKKPPAQLTLVVLGIILMIIPLSIVLIEHGFIQVVLDNIFIIPILAGIVLLYVGISI